MHTCSGNLCTKLGTVTLRDALFTMPRQKNVSQIQSVSKMTESQIKIIQEILDPENQFGHFWNPRTCSYLFG